MAKWNMEKLHEYESGNASGVDKQFDPVERPQHYGQGEIECIDYIQDFLSYNEYVGYLRGNMAKYLHRWRYKNGLEDLNKARWYLDRLAELEESK
jgi:hypothetical protein